MIGQVEADQGSVMLMHERASDPASEYQYFVAKLCISIGQLENVQQLLSTTRENGYARGIRLIVVLATDFTLLSTIWLSLEALETGSLASKCHDNHITKGKSCYSSCQLASFWLYVIKLTWSQCEAPFMYVKPRSVHDHNLCIACRPATCTVSWAHPFLMSEVWYLKHILSFFFFSSFICEMNFCQEGHWGITVWADDLCWPWGLCEMRHS